MRPRAKIIGLTICGIVAVAILGLLMRPAPTTTPARTEPPDFHARLLTEAQYRNIIADVFGDDVVVGGGFQRTLTIDGLQAIGAARMSIAATAFEHYDVVARSIASQVVDEKHRDILIGCARDSSNRLETGCIADFFNKVGTLLLRRPVPEAEIKELVSRAEEIAGKSNDPYVGVAYTLAGLLVRPDFLFIADVAVRNEDGNYVLDEYSKASRLSFLLWNTGPDAALLEAAGRGDLDDRRGLSKQVERMLASNRVKDGVRAFFSDMLGFDDFGELQKDPSIFPAFGQQVASDAREQTLRTIEHLLVTKRGAYPDIFTTRETFLSSRLGILYRVPIATPQGWNAHTFAQNAPYQGILTHASMTALHSHPGRTSPTIRGKAIRERLMCQRVPPPPGNVEFDEFEQDVSNPDRKTVRERLAAHASEPTCAGCHKITDPLGLSLENFDGAGQFRTMENGVVIDTSAEVSGKRVKDAAELGRLIAQDGAAASCLVKRLVEYGTGSLSGNEQSSWRRSLGEEFAESNFIFLDLLRSIATSDEFFALVSGSDT